MSTSADRIAKLRIALSVLGTACALLAVALTFVLLNDKVSDAAEQVLRLQSKSSEVPE